MSGDCKKPETLLPESIRAEVTEYTRDMLSSSRAIADLAATECGRWGALRDRMKSKDSWVAIMAAQELERWTKISDEAEEGMEWYDHAWEHIRGGDWGSECVHAVADQMISFHINELVERMVHDSMEAVRAEIPDDPNG